MHNLASYKTSDKMIYYSVTMDASRKLMQPLINTIGDYNPLFRQTHKKLSDKVVDVVNNNKLAIQQFTDLLTSITDKITSIQSMSQNTKNGLTDIREDLSQSIRNAEGKLNELEGQRAGLQEKKETLEKELKAKKKEYEIIDWLSIFTPLGSLLRAIGLLDSLLLGTMTQLVNTQREIQSLMTEKSHTQQVLEESTTAFNTNQSLSTHCINILNNINNLQTTLKEFKDLETYFFESQLAVLENNWTGLMKITNA